MQFKNKWEYDTFRQSTFKDYSKETVMFGKCCLHCNNQICRRFEDEEERNKKIWCKECKCNDCSALVIWNPEFAGEPGFPKGNFCMYAKTHACDEGG